MTVFHFFYGGPLSQRYRSVFKVNHVTYNCCEQYMMTQKAKLFGDREALAGIMASKEPMVQKSIGKTVRGFDETVWVRLREKIVFLGNYHKFTQSTYLESYLNSTGDLELVEASATDRIWGIGLSMTDERRLDRATWRGQNLLGKVLMDVRRLL